MLGTGYAEVVPYCHALSLRRLPYRTGSEMGKSKGGYASLNPRGILLELGFTEKNFACELLGIEKLKLNVGLLLAIKRA
jgi:hypothetical protein